ncbi:MAG: hypothetical protein EOO06_17810 [Chitinophagaceae bacterium]|nr:MAG: hypothetical protein EOO06_17810 [Chitinophagaceae bacterium]
MPDNSLEKNINNEMYDWKINPSPAVWAAVEEALDKKKRRYFFAWWWLLPILIGGTVLFLYLNREGDRGADQLAASEIAQTPKALNDTVAERMRSAETILTDGHRKDKVVRKTNIESTAEKNIKARELITDSISSNGFKSAARRRTINSKERQKISIQAPEIDDAGTEPDEIVEIIHQEGLTTKEIDITVSNPINDSVVPLANIPDQKVRKKYHGPMDEGAGAEHR